MCAINGTLSNCLMWSRACASSRWSSYSSPVHFSHNYRLWTFLLCSPFKLKSWMIISAAISSSTVCKPGYAMSSRSAGTWSARSLLLSPETKWSCLYVNPIHPAASLETATVCEESGRISQPSCSRNSSQFTISANWSTEYGLSRELLQKVDFRKSLEKALCPHVSFVQIHKVLSAGYRYNVLLRS